MKGPMKSLRTLPIQPRRDAWLEINLGAIEQNARAIRRHLPNSVALMAIVKADAYGHGAAMILPTLEASGVQMAGVASLDEALHLREAGIKLPILVIGVVPDWAMQAAAEANIQLTIFDEHHLDSLRNAWQPGQKPFRVHVKVDTGMHRIGIDWQQAAEFVRRCRELAFIELEGIFSHFADSHAPHLSSLQLERWQHVCQAIQPLPRYVHISNSGHALQPHDVNLHPHPLPPNTLARLGIAFFGYGLPTQQENIQLKPALSLKARILHLHAVPPGTGISYGHSFITAGETDSLIATVPIGYADGVPRRLSNQICGLLNGQSVRQVGKITMDQMMFDVSNVTGVRVGDAITLLGQDGAGSLAGDAESSAIWLDDWAKKADTIEYELMCALRVRLPRTYTR